MTKQVAFDTVQIRSYNQVLGDQPYGLSVELDWSYAEEDSTSLEAFEAHRDGSRRHGFEMLMPSWLIIQRLQEHGYSRRQVHEHMQKHSREWKRNRQQLSTRPCAWRDRMADTKERVSRRVKRVLLGSKQNGITWRDSVVDEDAATAQPQRSILRFKSHADVVAGETDTEDSTSSVRSDS